MTGRGGREGVELGPLPLTIGDDHDTPHAPGAADCNAGWCGASGYPKPCREEGCAGLVHASFGDEWHSEDDYGYWLWTRCDRCGEIE